jgi:hypothetical protein
MDAVHEREHQEEDAERTGRASSPQSQPDPGGSQEKGEPVDTAENR